MQVGVSSMSVASINGLNLSSQSYHFPSSLFCLIWTSRLILCQLKIRKPLEAESFLLVAQCPLMLGSSGWYHPRQNMIRRCNDLEYHPSYRRGESHAHFGPWKMFKSLDYRAEASIGLLCLQLLKVKGKVGACT